MNYENPQGVSIHDGFPNPATDISLQILDLNQLLIRHPVSTYFMRVVGNNGEKHGVFEGDFIIVDRAINPKPWHPVIYWQDDSMMVCRFARMPRHAEVWGVATSIIHQFVPKS